MNLLEAIKSGCPFRRKIWDEDMWCHVTSGTDGCQEVLFMRPHNGKQNFLPLAYDLLADDWEIQERSVTITFSQLYNVFMNTAVRDATSKNSFWISQDSITVIARKLGLKG